MSHAGATGPFSALLTATVLGTGLREHWGLFVHHNIDGLLLLVAGAWRCLPQCHRLPGHNKMWTSEATGHPAASGAGSGTCRAGFTNAGRPAQRPRAHRQQPPPSLPVPVHIMGGGLIGRWKEVDRKGMVNKLVDSFFHAHLLSSLSSARRKAGDSPRTSLASLMSVLPLPLVLT